MLECVIFSTYHEPLRNHIPLMPMFFQIKQSKINKYITDAHSKLSIYINLRGT
jgi:hypothetical protein